jgi:EAL domain-containing protein (putative c-di-GMP-specific phosphodiesterase class I)
VTPKGAAAAAPAADEEVSRLLSHGFLSMAFQPIVEIETGRKLGFEALLRGPRGTPLSLPGILFGSGRALSGDVLRQLDLACVDAALRSGGALPKGALLFINIQTGATSLAGRELFSLMEALEIDPKSVVLEVSETLADGARARAIAKRLLPFRRKGVRLALDDVGVRVPWLSHLLHLEPEWVKVDRSFVRNVHRSPRMADLLLGLRELTGRMGARVIAEGIESAEDARALSRVGIPLGQGRRFGRPAPAEAWLDRPARRNLWKRPVDAIHVRPGRARL